MRNNPIQKFKIQMNQFVWEQEQRRIFFELRERFQAAPLMGHFDEDDDSKLCTVASWCRYHTLARWGRARHRIR